MSRLRYFSIFILAFALTCLWNFAAGSSSPVSGDDIWAATSVMGRWLDTIVFTLRFDLHPPLYYFLLNIWAVVSQSDLWLRASSVFIHALLVVSCYVVAKRRSGDEKVALLACLLVLISPALLDYSNNLRMYGLIALLSVWIFHFTESIVSENYKHWLLLFVLELALVYTHAIGIIFVFFHFLYGLICLTGEARGKLFRWIVHHALIFIASIPVLLNSLVRSAEHAAIPSPLDMASLYSMVWLPPGEFKLVALVVSVGFIALLVANKRHWKVGLCYVVSPIFIYFAVSVLVKPLWLGRNFIFSFPILLIVFSQWVVCNSALNGRIKYTLVVALIVSCLTSQWLSVLNLPPGNFSITLRDIQNKKNMTDRLCIVVPESIDKYWSLMRYTVGTEWGNPLVIQPESSERWIGIINKIPEGISEFLKLKPKQHFATGNGYVVTTNPMQGCSSYNMGEVYFVN